jgi:glycosyltransferase involved in cell wall biosynthesis
MIDHTFSVITVCKNTDKTIEKTIKSVISQLYKNFEYIVIDGCSEDETISIIKKYREKIDYFISEKDNGIYEAMNKGISVAKGEIISFINADDFLFSEKVLYHVNNLINQFSSVNADVYHGAVLRYDDKTGAADLWKSRPLTRFRAYRGAIPHPATFYRRNAFKKNGLFDESYKVAGDYEWMVRALIRNKLRFQYIGILAAVFCKGGISNNLKFADLNELEKQRSIKTHYLLSEVSFFPILNRVRKIFGL